MLNSIMKRFYLLGIFIAAIGLGFFFINSSYENLVYNKYIANDSDWDVGYASIIGISIVISFLKLLF